MSDTIGQFFTEQPKLGLRVAQAVGITGSAYLFGQNAFISYGVMPAILKAPAPLAAKQWLTVYNAGHIVGPILALVGGLTTGYVASHQDPKSFVFKLNVAAAAILPSIIPFTFAFILPTNNKLFQKADSLASASLEDKSAEAGVAQEETTHALIDKWATLNLARALITGTGTILAVWAAMSKREIVGFRDIGLSTGANRLG